MIHGYLPAVTVIHAEGFKYGVEGFGVVGGLSRQCSDSVAFDEVLDFEAECQRHVATEEEDGFAW